MKFSELVRKLKSAGFRVAKEKGSVRYYGKDGWYESTIMEPRKFPLVPATLF